jgi:hypothetical protein
MKTYISALAIFISIASANIIIKSEEAKQLIQSRTGEIRSKRGVCWSKKCRLKRFDRECTAYVCDTFEEFQEGAENVYGKPLIRRDDRVKEAYQNLYLQCHNENQFCVTQKKNCKCNKWLKAWLEDPSKETEPPTTTIPPTTTTTSTTTASTTTGPTKCWIFCSDDSKVTTSTTVGDGPSTTASNKATTECTGWFCPTPSSHKSNDPKVTTASNKATTECTGWFCPTPSS